jgi:hypothetical protein
MPQRQFRLLVLATLLFACGAQTPTYGQTIKGMQVVGYADHLSVEAGGTVRVMVSSELPRYRADIVRLIHGDTNPKGPGFKEELIEAPVTKNIQEFGAAGDEVDRLDVQLGTPPNTLLLATTLTMSNGYQHVVEEVLQSDSHQGGMVNPWVKGDIVLVEVSTRRRCFFVELDYLGWQPVVQRLQQCCFESNRERVEEVLVGCRAAWGETQRPAMI